MNKTKDPSQLPISTRTPTVTIEYDSRGKRVRKLFESAYEARRFFVRKDRNGKHPRIARKG